MKRFATFFWVALFCLLFVGEADSYQTSKKIHPVILVHGINDEDRNWERDNSGVTIYRYVENDGYEMRYVTTFSYLADQSANDAPADSFGDVSTAATYLNNEIDSLYAQSGGTKVDIVAHSLGGLVTREYLRQHPSDHKIGKFIDIATPHSGSSIIGFYASLPKELQSGVTNALNFVQQKFGYSAPDPNSTAAHQLTPNSPFLQTLNAENSPSNVQYWMLYGDIQLQVKVELFWFEVYSHPLMGGDLVVSRENAATIPKLGSFGGSNPSDYHTIGFQSPTNLALVANIVLDTVDFNVQIDGPLDGFIPYWHNGLLRNPDLNQKVLAILNDGYVPPAVTVTPVTPIAITVTPSQPISYGTSSTALLFDVSGSMDEQDVSGVTKLDSAKGAGARILDIIQAENSASQGADVSILSFSDGAWVNSSLSTDVDSARAALGNLSARSGTGMPDGLRLAIDQFQNKKDSKPIIILLSDGLPNIGLSGSLISDPSEARQQVLDLASEAGGKGICIYTVGFGVPNTVGLVSGEASIDEDFLRQVANNSGCGAYYNAQNAIDLANVYVNLRHESTGTVLLKKTGDIAQGQTVDIGATAVSQGTDEMLFTLNWPGSRLDPTLIDPNGKIVDQNYPGASFFQSKSLASVIIKNPAPGNWTFKAFGAEVPEGILKYQAVASVRTIQLPPPSPGGSSVILVVVPLLIGGLMTYIFVVSAKREQKHVRVARTGGATATLYIVSGQGVGRSILLRDNSIIGRSRISTIHIDDPSVSRRHARIRCSNGQWFIQDMGSSSGTYLNGARVSASALRSGDHIRIGLTELQFQQ